MFSPNSDKRFLFLSRNKEETAADILYKNTNNAKKEEQERNNLLNELGDKLTPAQTLYSNINELKEIKKGTSTGGASEIGDYKNTNKSALQNTTEFLIGKNYNKPLNSLTKAVSGKDAAGRLDLAHGINMNDRSYIRNVIHLKNYNDPQVNQDKEYLREKINKQFKDYNFDTNKIKGYIFKDNHESSTRIANNKDFHKFLQDKKDELLTKNEASGSFPQHFAKILPNSNLHNAIGKFDVRNAHLDKDGNLRLKLYDTYDFNNENSFLIQAGRNQMKENNLKPYFTINDILIPKDKLKEIWK